MAKKLVSIFLIALIIINILGVTALADQYEVVSLGANLDDSQKEEMLKLFQVKEEDVQLIEVTNKEEREYLEGLVPDSTIGTRAISSVYVKPLKDGDGIAIETKNITWVSEEMFANSMVTAGIKDAKVVAAAPFKVSGTAALTGIMKAFEVALGEDLDEDAKKVANEELVITGDIGDEVGQKEAAQLIKEIKEEIVSKKPKDEQDIIIIIKNISKKLEIQLNDEQIAQILELMKKISQLNLSIENISEQLDKIGLRVEDIKDVVKENKGAIKKILDAINRFFSWLKSILD
ncbi:MAG: DUF1002 domain-containing protein [Clostridiales bacterium]|nr:DUF1002 domain-containing protein [Clostridiales bacterium]